MKSISHCQGKGSLSHNNREFHPKNVDPSRTPNNIIFVKKPIGTTYEKLFGAAVERYNAKQKRSDRKIKNGYYEYQFNHKISQNVVTSPDKRKSFYEDVVQIGTMKDKQNNKTEKQKYYER
ncbi:MAG: plasmid recombination protein [Ruminococcus sp.]|nr:plasmid recombination protein [Ruminococcus sp.]MCM1380505.1 plasmid recombination protein [Muribaculaceae bacterium]MCM1478879.1 plasmid recombination protein [Muribaculaceae bacterium]